MYVAPPVILHASHFTRLSGPNTTLSVDQHHGLRLGVTFNFNENTALNLLDYRTPSMTALVQSFAKPTFCVLIK
jgi:hypothetical protein